MFEKLVPAGRGRLIIQRQIDQDEDEVEDIEDMQQSSIDNYTGVLIKVNLIFLTCVDGMLMLDTRYLLIPKLMKVCRYNNCLVVRSCWLH